MTCIILRLKQLTLPCIIRSTVLLSIIFGMLLTLVYKIHSMFVVAVLLTEDADNRSIDFIILPGCSLSVSGFTDPSTSQIMNIVMPEEALALQLNSATPLAEILVACGYSEITAMML